MRLNRLDLLRYGRFRDASITLPERAAGACDVTVIYGPNEAGKSTAFRAYLDLIFGLPNGKHDYAFGDLERSDLRVGGSITIPGQGASVYVRDGKSTGSLRDADGRSVDEGPLRSALHGLDRASYIDRFSLNEVSLRDGGRKIAEAKGDLGQLLHAGVSGLTSVAGMLARLDADAAAFHKKRGQSTTLRKAQNRLKEIDTALRTERLTPERETALREALDRADAAFDQAHAAWLLAKQRQEAGKAAQAWFAANQEAHALGQRLRDLPDGPDLPAGTAERITGRLRDIDHAQTTLRETDDELADLKEQLAQIERDPSAAALAQALDQLDSEEFGGTTLESRAKTAHADLGRRRQAVEDLRTALSTTAARIAPDAAPEALVLSPDVLSELDEALRVAQQAARDAAHSAAERDRAQAQLGPEPEAPRDLNALAEAREAWEAAQTLAPLRAALAEAEDRLAEDSAALPANWRTLVDAGLPAPETLTQLATVDRELTQKHAQVAAALEDVAAALTLAKAALGQNGASGTPVTLADIEATRRARDTAWQAHRATLDHDSAGRFETALHADDAARAEYVDGASARDRHARAQSDVATAEAKLTSAQDTAAKLTEAMEVHASRCAQAMQALGLPQGSAPAGFTAQRDRLDRAATAHARLARAQAALTAAEISADAALAALTQTAAAFGITAHPAALPARVFERLTRQTADTEAWTRWTAAKAAVDKLQARAAQAKLTCQSAEARLQAATAGYALPQSAEALAPHLTALRDLQTIHTELQSTQTRVAQLKDGLARFEAWAAPVRELLTLEAATGALDVLAQARQRHARAAAAARAQAALTSAMEKAAQSQRRAKAALDQARGDVAAAFAGQGGAELADRDRLHQLDARDGLRREKARAEAARDRAASGVEAALFAAESARLPDAARAGVLAQDLDDAQRARDTARDAQRDAQATLEAAYAATDPSALIAERATILEELRDGARHAAMAQLGAIAARGALRTLAADRRSEMVRDVERAFVTMTAPKWTGVEVWSEAEGEKLVGISADGTRVKAEAMSTGTMGQLYFALRLAGYQRFARAPGPLPMVLDDIMETFDDARAKAALSLCAEVGRVGQAIMFTHHAHLLDLARDAIPGVAIVDMPR
ncbi:MAG: AAA family ATPase [Pseudomonadota bacterium]